MFEKSWCQSLLCIFQQEYIWEMILTFRKHIAFVRTGNEIKSKSGEPDCCISAVTCGCQDIVTNGQVVQSADHEFALLNIDTYCSFISWYTRCHKLINLYRLPLQDSKNQHNWAIKSVLVDRFGDLLRYDILHRWWSRTSNFFLFIKIAVIVEIHQRFICILNISLYGWH